jgi:hypothetical protein
MTRLPVHCVEVATRKLLGSMRATDQEIRCAVLDMYRHRGLRCQVLRHGIATRGRGMLVPRTRAAALPARSGRGWGRARAQAASTAI